MNIARVRQVLGGLVLLVACCMVLTLPLSLYYGDGMWLYFLEAVGALVPLGLGCLFIRPPEKNALFTQREAIGVVVFGWLAVSMAGALPYWLSGRIPSWTDAFFESISGFTTTGSSILANIEALPPSLLFWRALTHWVGGLGIVLLAVVILPIFTTAGTILFRTETSQLSQQKLVPRIKENGRILWIIYLAITAVLVLLLLLGGMSLFDAVTHAFATVATGGFSPKNGSVADYHSAYIDLVITFGMFCSSVNFTLYYHLGHGQLRPLWNDDALRFYFLTTATSVAAISAYLLASGHYHSLGEAVRYVSFQVVSIHSTTGFATADYEQWGTFPQGLLLLLMLMGACPGSTSGAIKNLRVLVLLRACRREIARIINPRLVVSTRLLHRGLPEVEVARLGIFVGVYLLGVGLFTLAISAFEVDLATAFSATAATMGGVGPGIGQVGPMDNFSGLPGAVKWLLMGCMLLGRLEIMAVLAVFHPFLWKRH